MKRIGAIFLWVFTCWGAVAAELPEISEEALAELGSYSGMPQMTGFVFIGGRYLPPPYTVSRKGNGLFINRILVEQPVAWPSAGPEAGGGQKRPADADGELEKEEDADATLQPGAPEAAKPVKSIDDLFADDEEKPASSGALAPGGVAETAAKETTQQGRPLATDAEPRQKKEELRANLERLRKGYELALAQGEVFFFSHRANRVNGNYGTARTLMSVLPKALRYAQSPQDLMQRLKQGGVYFIDLGMCSELFLYKNTFPLLEERLAKIEEAEAVEAMKSKPATRW